GGFQNGEDLLAFVNQNGISGTYDAGTGILTLTGSASIADYQAALRSVTYAETSDPPNTGDRTISFVVDDGTGPSAVATRTVRASNAVPVVTASGGTPAANEQVAIAVYTGLTLSDPDNDTLPSPRASDPGGFQSGEDVLAFVNQNGITGSYNAGTGELTLTGS